MDKINQNKRFTVSKFLTMVVVFSFFVGILISISELSRYLFRIFPMIFFGISFCLVVFVLFGTLVTEREKLETSFKVEGGEIDIAGILVGIFASTILFGLFSRELYINNGVNFVGVIETNRLLWLGFAIDNLLEAILFDIPSIYKLHFTSIEPYSLFSRTSVFSFRLIIDFILIRTLIKHWHVLRNITVKEHN